MNSSKKYDLSELVELDLSRDEDSVTSISFANTDEARASAFAGINSSTKEQEAGRNRHLRSFLLQYPPRRKVGENQEEEKENAPDPQLPSKAMGNVSYFTPTPGPKPETFQRVLRLSKQPKENGPRLGAVATGLAPEGEIVTFAADTDKPSENDIRDRIKLGDKKEASDLDIVTDRKGAFWMAYCTDHDIWHTKCYYNYDRPKTLDPQCIHSIPFPDVFTADKSRPKYRSLRFLTPNLLLVLLNFPAGKGSELLLMTDLGEILLRKRLHKKIKSGTKLAVSTLPFTDPGAGSKQKCQQVIAVAGADNSITILTLTHNYEGPYRSLKFQPHLFLTDVHPTSITSLVFSTHNPPTKTWSQLPPQYLKLASTSIANTVVVHTVPLQPYPPRKLKSDTVAHYLLVPPGGTKRKLQELGQSLLVASILMAVVALLMQILLEIQGSRNHLGIHTWYEKPWEEKFRFPQWTTTTTTTSSSSNPAEAAPPLETFYGGSSDSPSDFDPQFSTDPAAESTPQKPAQAGPGLRELLRQRQQSPLNEDDTAEGKANHHHHIVIQHHPHSDPSKDHQDDDDKADQSTSQPGRVRASLHHPDTLKTETEHGGAKKWEDLSHREKETWKGRLMEAGEWAVEEGESVLQGVFFGGIAQGVGAIVGGG